MNQLLPVNEREAAMMLRPPNRQLRGLNHIATGNALALPLLVSGIGRANDIDLAFAANQLAAFTNPLDACANFH
jgi:hypothetical protein